MSQKQDLEFAKIILKQGWMDKETLEQMLRQVKKIRESTPSITLERYLHAKDQLTGEQLKWAHDALRDRSHHASGHAHASRSSGRHASRSHHGKHGHHGRHHSYRRKKSSLAPLFVGLGLGLVVLVVALMVLNKDDPQDGHGHDQPGNGHVASTPEAGDNNPQDNMFGSPEEAMAYSQLKLADGSGNAQGIVQRADVFLQRFPQSQKKAEILAMRKRAHAKREEAADKELANVRSQYEGNITARNFSLLINQYQYITLDFGGTNAAEEASKDIAKVEKAWAAEVKKALDDIQALEDDGKYREALAAVKTLLAWCDEANRREALRKQKSLNMAIELAQSIERRKDDAGDDMNSPRVGNDPGDDLAGNFKPEEDDTPRENPFPEEDLDKLFPKGKDFIPLPPEGEDGQSEGLTEEELEKLFPKNPKEPSEEASKET